MEFQAKKKTEVQMFVCMFWIDLSLIADPSVLRTSKEKGPLDNVQYSLCSVTHVLCVSNGGITEEFKLMQQLRS